MRRGELLCERYRLRPVGRHRFHLEGLIEQHFVCRIARERTLVKPGGLVGILRGTREASGEIVAEHRCRNFVLVEILVLRICRSLAEEPCKRHQSSAESQTQQTPEESPH